MRKAKKKVHPMPKLGWLDSLIYWSGIILCIIGCIAAVLIPRLVRENHAFADPDVIATSAGEGAVHFIWLTIWLITMGCIIYAVYKKRYPIFGRKDIQYGPPAYPRIFPLLMKDPPTYWESPKKVAQRKQLLKIGAVVMSLWLLISLWVYPASMYERADLYSNGVIVTYDAGNQPENYYRTSEVESIGFRVFRVSQKGADGWRLDFIINLRDGEQITYQNNAFRGELEDALRAMLVYKERYSGTITFSGVQNMEKLIDYFNMTETEIQLLYKIFE